MSNKKWYDYFVERTPAEAAAATAAEPERVADIAASVPPVTVDEAAVTSTSMADIYASAQIPAPAHGYTVLKVAEMLQNEHIRALPAEVKQKSIMVALDAAGVKVADIVEDAVKRDRALDTYERVLVKHLDDLRNSKAAENQQLEQEINQRVAELKARIDQNNAELTAEQNNLLAWRASKRQEEDRIAETIGHFVSENPITTSKSDKGGANV